MDCYKLGHQYIIKAANDTVVWIEILDSDCDPPLVVEGECVVDEALSMLFLSGWKDTYPLDENIDIKRLALWDKTRYYAVMSDSGNMKIYYVDSGQSVTENEFKQLASRIGCTMRYK